MRLPSYIRILLNNGLLTPVQALEHITISVYADPLDFVQDSLAILEYSFNS